MVDELPLRIPGENPVGKPADKVPVVGDEQERAVEVLHRLLNPLPRVDIQVVGRLVQHQQVDGVVHQRAQSQAALLPAGELVDPLELLLPTETEGAQAVARRLRRHPLFVDERLHQGAPRMGEGHLLGQVAGL